MMRPSRQSDGGSAFRLDWNLMQRRITSPSPRSPTELCPNEMHVPVWITPQPINPHYFISMSERRSIHGPQNSLAARRASVSASVAPPQSPHDAQFADKELEEIRRYEDFTTIGRINSPLIKDILTYGERLGPGRCSWTISTTTESSWTTETVAGELVQSTNRTDFWRWTILYLHYPRRYIPLVSRCW